MTTHTPFFDQTPNEHKVMEWLRLVRSGSPGALTELLRSCQTYLTIVANRELDAELRSKIEPSAIVQECLQEAKEGLSRFNGTTDAEVFAWLRRILLNNVDDVRMRVCGTSKRELTHKASHESRTQDSLLSLDTAVSYKPLTQKRREELEAAISKLPESMRQAIVLRHRDGLPFESMSETNDKNTDVARKTWANAVESLQSILSPCTPEDTQRQNSCEDEFARILAEFDENIARGIFVDSSHFGPNQELHSRIERLHPCLELLNQAWPRKIDLGYKPLFIEQKIGRFTIEKELGHGGYGFVYLAYDPRLKRQVAIKVPRPEILSLGSMRARFQREAELAAQLEHQNLVAIHEVELDGPTIFLVCEYCAGPSLANWLRSLAQLPSPRVTAEILQSLASAVDYMHRQGILHRDIKPGNVLLAPVSGTHASQSGWIPKLTDFGLATLADPDTPHTRTGALIGTLAYLPPERVEFREESLGPAVDIYSLGVVLYECLTGRPPFVGATEADVIRQLLSDAPISPRKLRQEIPHDLEVICLKCLDKEPRRRYASAEDLAADLTSFLNGSPIKARPVGFLEKSVKWIRRHPAISTMSAITVLASLGLLCLGIWYGITLQRHESELQLALDRVQRSERQLLAENYAVQIKTAQSLTDGELRTNLIDVLERLSANDRDFTGRFEWKYLRNIANEYQILRGHRRSISSVAVSPDGQLLSSVSSDGNIKLWQISSRSQIAEWNISNASTFEVCFSRDGKSLKVIHFSEPDSISLDEINIHSGEYNHINCSTKLNWVTDFSVTSSDHEFLVIGGNVGLIVTQVFIWNSETGSVRHLKLPSDFIGAIARLSPNRRFLLITSQSQPENVFVWDLSNDQLPTKLPFGSTAMLELAWSPDNSSVAIGTIDGRIELWNLEESKLTGSWRDLDGKVYHLQFDPTGRHLATIVGPAEKNPRVRTIKVFDVNDEDVLINELTPDAYFERLNWTPDGSTIVFGSFDHHVRLWRPFNSPSSTTLDVSGKKEAWGLAFSPDGSQLAVGYDDEPNQDRETLKIWSVNEGNQPLSLEGHQGMVNSLKFSPDGTKLYSGAYDNTVRSWDAVHGNQLGIVGKHNKPIRAIAISNDGKLLASCGRDQVTKVWNLEAGELKFVLSDYRDIVRDVAFTADGKWVVTSDNTGEVRFWNSSNGEHIKRLVELVPIGALAINHDGQLIATGNQDGYLSIYEIEGDSEPVTSFVAHQGEIRCVTFTPDGKCVVTGGLDRMVKFWHLETGRELLTFADLSAPVNRLEFSPDGNRLAASLLDGSVKIWHAEEANNSLSTLTHGKD